MVASCSKAKCGSRRVKYHYVNFQSEIGQLNLLEGATAKQILEMLIEGLDLVLTGGDSDYYKAIGQRAAKFLANNYEAGETFADLFRKHENIFERLMTVQMVF